MIAIFKATLKETFRKKTFAVMGVIAVLFFILWSLLLHYGLHMGMHFKGNLSDVADYLMTIMGLQFSSMLLALFTIMLSSGAISSDLETGLVHGIISRPIRRFEYVLGKLTGLALMTAIVSTVFYALILIIGRISNLSTITVLTVWQVIGGWLLFMTVPLAVLCLTLWGSVKFKTISNGIIMIFIFILGLIGGMVEMVGQLLNSVNINSGGIFLSLVSPFHMLYITCQNFLLPSSNITQNIAQFAGGLTGSGAPPSIWMYIYTAVYVVAFVLLAFRNFSRKDIT